MSAITTRTSKKSNTKAVWIINNEVFRYVVAFVPEVHQTLSLNGEVIEPSRRFAQRSSEVYHACGSDLPCHLLSQSQSANRA